MKTKNKMYSKTKDNDYNSNRFLSVTPSGQTNKCSNTFIMLTHEGNNKFACTLCENRFLVYIYSKRHMTVHTDGKPYTCTSCDRMFSHRSSLTRHMLLHRDCGSKFFSLSDGITDDGPKATPLPDDITNDGHKITSLVDITDDGPRVISPLDDCPLFIWSQMNVTKSSRQEMINRPANCVAMLFEENKETTTSETEESTTKSNTKAMRVPTTLK